MWTRTSSVPPPLPPPPPPLPRVVITQNSWYGGGLGFRIKILQFEFSMQNYHYRFLAYLSPQIKDSRVLSSTYREPPETRTDAKAYRGPGTH